MIQIILKIGQDLLLEKLIFYAKDLAQSLGLSVSLVMTEHEKPPFNTKTFKDGRLLHTHYAFHITGEKIKNIPCLIERKKASVKCVDNEFCNSNTSVIKITPYTESNNFIGLIVDDNHNFLLEDCTVVHDSTCI